MTGRLWWTRCEITTEALRAGLLYEMALASRPPDAGPSEIVKVLIHADDQHLISPVTRMHIYGRETEQAA